MNELQIIRSEYISPEDENHTCIKIITSDSDEIEYTTEFTIKNKEIKNISEWFLKLDKTVKEKKEHKDQYEIQFEDENKD